jgi:lipopolysaccharide cholinephosphotransferase
VHHYANKGENMKRIDNNQIQPMLLNLLKVFKTFAKQEDFKFMLCGGSLLGAVRHNGFIPWDDDIDLHISKETYEKLIDRIKVNPYIDEERRYKLLAPAKYPNAYPFLKLVDTKTVLYEKDLSRKYAIGLYLDIFCLSYLPEDMKEHEALFNQQQKYKAFNKILVAGNFSTLKYKLVYPFVFIAKLILLAIGKNSEYWGKKILALDTYKESNFIGNVQWPSSVRDRFPREWFEDTVSLTFEDTEFDAPICYKEVLETLYGDYMQLPPIEKRIRHDFELYEKE